MKFEKIQKKLKKIQDSKRFEHTMGVSYTASCLAMRYKADVEKARLAGLLHDCAKQISDKKKIKLCKKNGLSISTVEMDNPFLLHSKVGSLIARKKYKVKDEDILNSITFHTTGRPGMSQLEKIIFVSDYIEPNRNTAPNLDMIRTLAFEDLDLCLIKILEDTLNYLNQRRAVIDPSTQETYDYYIKEKLING